MHPSRVEAKHCNELHLQQRAGFISDLRHEVQFWFEVNGKPLKHRNGRRAGFKVDFTYTRVSDGRKVAREVKGHVVRDFSLRRALFMHLFPEYEYEEMTK